ncbi:MAG: hypothetical protein QG591_2405, partial [Planctomycetota bacterium]|nr:hypothetical protein [Planctomycetota bacterium]
KKCGSVQGWKINAGKGWQSKAGPTTYPGYLNYADTV